MEERNSRWWSIDGKINMDKHLSTNIQHPLPRQLFKMIFLFPRWDLLVAMRVKHQLKKKAPPMPGPARTTGVSGDDLMQILFWWMDILGWSFCWGEFLLVISGKSRVANRIYMFLYLDGQLGWQPACICSDEPMGFRNSAVGGSGFIYEPPSWSMWTHGSPKISKKGQKAKFKVENGRVWHEIQDFIRLDSALGGKNTCIDPLRTAMSLALGSCVVQYVWGLGA